MPLTEKQDCAHCGNRILLTESFRMVPGAWFHLGCYDAAAQITAQQTIRAAVEAHANDRAKNYKSTEAV